MIFKRCVTSGLFAFSALAGTVHAQLLETDGATLRTLDKITGRAEDKEIDLDETIAFGSLQVKLRACYQSRPEDTPESAAYLEIEDVDLAEAIQISASDYDEDATGTVFSGWMYASSPGLSALEHPVYDVWVIKCNALPPEVLLEYTLEDAVTNDAGSVEGDAVMDTSDDDTSSDFEEETTSEVEELSLDELLSEPLTPNDRTESQE